MYPFIALLLKLSLLPYLLIPLTLLTVFLLFSVFSFSGILFETFPFSGGRGNTPPSLPMGGFILDSWESGLDPCGPGPRMATLFRPRRFPYCFPYGNLTVFLTIQKLVLLVQDCPDNTEIGSLSARSPRQYIN